MSGRAIEMRGHPTDCWRSRIARLASSVSTKSCGSTGATRKISPRPVAAAGPARQRRQELAAGRRVYDDRRVTYDHPLADDEKRELLRIARATLREHGYSGRIPPGKPHRESLVAPAAVFVSLHKGDALRGCIGGLEADKPLYRAIQEMAVAAAM